jgi:hypothetical protein
MIKSRGQPKCPGEHRAGLARVPGSGIPILVTVSPHPPQKPPLLPVGHLGSRLLTTRGNVRPLLTGAEVVALGQTLCKTCEELEAWRQTLPRGGAGRSDQQRS